MKVKFSTDTSFIPSWKGNKELSEADRVTVRLKALNTQNLLIVLDAIQGEDGKAGRTHQLVALADVLKEHATIVNLTDDDGPVDMVRALNIPFYMGLIGEIVTELANASMPNEDDSKNSETQPA